jgi:hypothetical protein
VSLPSGRFVWLGVRTSDGRDGVAPGALAEAVSRLSRISGAAGRIGIMANWGCLGSSPSSDEIHALAGVLTRTESEAACRLPVSLGGSTLLPMLSDVRPLRPREIRIGEALVAGTVPGGDGRSLGLKRPVRLESRIVEVQEVGEARRLLLDHGRTCIEIDEATILNVAAKPLAASSEMSLFELSRGAAIPQAGERIELILGYHSTLRSLLNRTERRRFV